MKTPELFFGVNPITYPQKKGAKKKGKPVNLGKVAIWNEYGTEDIPPRPAFRMGLDFAIKKHKKLMDAQLKNITQRILSGRKDEIVRSLTVVLTQIGRSAEAHTKELIKNGSVSPSNAPSTILRKGFDHPLKETGLLMKNIKYEVRQ